MRLATLRRDGNTVAVRIDGQVAVEITGREDVGEVLRRGELDLAATADGRRHDLATADLAPVVTWPGKTICVGLNYRTHILEMGRELPEYPTLFTKFPEALIGPRDDIQLPPETSRLDWEAELVVVIGSTVRRATPEAARGAIAGYTIMNDVTMRDFQYRTLQWVQGKSWEASTPLGPVLVTPEELAPDAVMTCELDGEIVQQTTIDDLVFDSAALVQYISTIMTLRPGDIIATGTPGGVGHAREPARYMSAGQVLRTSVDGIGELVNRVVAEDVAGVPADSAGHGR